MNDVISRQAAVDALDKHLQTTDVPVSYPGIISALTEWLNELPSAQPDSKELSFTQKKLDTISRQAAIRWVKTECNPYGKPTLDFESGKKVIEHLKQLPSAQPEKRTEERTETHSCDYINRKDAIDAHYEYCNKHPDASFPVWSLKILEDLPSAQPDLSEYSDKLWKAAYERGRAEALAEIVRCKDCIFHGLCRISPKWAVAPKDDWYCADAERSTDERCD